MIAQSSGKLPAPSPGYLSFRRGKPLVDIDSLASKISSLLHSSLQAAQAKRTCPTAITTVAYLLNNGEITEALNGVETSLLIKCTLKIQALLNGNIELEISTTNLRNPQKRRDTTASSPLDAIALLIPQLTDRLSSAKYGAPLITKGKEAYWANIGRQMIVDFMSNDQYANRLLNEGTTTLWIAETENETRYHTMSPKAGIIGTLRIDHALLRDRDSSPISDGGEKNEICRLLLEGMNSAMVEQYEKRFPNPHNLATSVRHVPCSSFPPIGKILQATVSPTQSLQPTYCSGQGFQGDSTWLRGHNKIGIAPLTDAVAAIRYANGWIGLLASAHGHDLSTFKEQITSKINNFTQSLLGTVQAEYDRIARHGISVPRDHALQKAAERFSAAVSTFEYNNGDSLFVTNHIKNILQQIRKWAASAPSIVLYSPSSENPNEVATSYFEALKNALKEEMQGFQPKDMEDLVAKAILNAVNYMAGELSIHLSNVDNAQIITSYMKQVALDATQHFFYGKPISVAFVVMQEGESDENQLTICSTGSAKIYRIQPSGKISDLSFHTQKSSTWRMHTTTCPKNDQVIALSGGAIEILRLAAIGGQSPRAINPASAESDRVDLITGLEQTLAVASKGSFIDAFRNLILPLTSKQKEEAPCSFALLSYASSAAYWEKIGIEIVNELKKFSSLPSSVWICLSDQGIVVRDNDSTQAKDKKIGSITIDHAKLRNKGINPFFHAKPYSEYHTGFLQALEVINQQTASLADHFFPLLVSPNFVSQPSKCTRKNLQGNTFWIRGHVGQGEQEVPCILAMTQHKRGWCAVLTDSGNSEEERKNVLDILHTLTQDPSTIMVIPTPSMTAFSVYDGMLASFSIGNGKIFVKRGEKIQTVNLNQQYQLDEQDQVIAMTGGAMNILSSLTSQQNTSEEILSEILTLSPTRDLIQLFKNMILSLASRSGRNQPLNPFALLSYPPLS